MSKKRDNSVVAVITGLSSRQAANISRDIMISKQRHAPFGRGIISKGSDSVIGTTLGKGNKLIRGGK